MSTLLSTGTDPKELCNRWMPRKRTACARRPGHRGDCRTAEAMKDSRQPMTDRRRGTRIKDDPITKTRWSRTYRLARYGLTRDQFDRLLEIQGHACGMCHASFAQAQLIFIDHDHDCCETEKSSCGKCVRGLLCLSCNTGLGVIERKYDLARAYLESRPGQGLPEAERVV
jgi:hypothetical protein